LVPPREIKQAANFGGLRMTAGTLRARKDFRQRLIQSPFDLFDGSGYRDRCWARDAQTTLDINKLGLRPIA
jgi:hypothetical protein